MGIERGPQRYSRMIRHRRAPPQGRGAVMRRRLARHAPDSPVCAVSLGWGVG